MLIGICDDSIENIKKIENLIVEYYGLKNEKCPAIKSFSNPSLLLRCKEKIDLLFLDIEMPEYDGIYLGTFFSNKDFSPLIIVVTAYMDYLDDAMKFNVFRYLSKPLDKNRFFKNMNEALDVLEMKNQTVVVECKNGIYKLKLDDIVLIESNKRKCYLHTENEVLETVIKIEQWDSILNNKIFFRTHKSFIVNLKKVVFFDHSHVELGNCDIYVYLSLRKYTKFKQAFFKSIERA